MWRSAQLCPSNAERLLLVGVETGTIRELGEFYRKKGQRARLPLSFGEELLAKLAAAEKSLPLASSADGKQTV